MLLISYHLSYSCHLHILAICFMFHAYIYLKSGYGNYKGLKALLSLYETMTIYKGPRALLSLYEIMTIYKGPKAL